MRRWFRTTHGVSGFASFSASEQEDGARDPRLVSQWVRRSSLNVAARFARPVEICARLVLGLRSSRRSYPKARAACGT